MHTHTHTPNEVKLAASASSTMDNTHTYRYVGCWTGSCLPTLGVEDPKASLSLSYRSATAST